jgi:hypothetical protein
MRVLAGNVRLNPPEPGFDGPRYPPRRGPSLSLAAHPFILLCPVEHPVVVISVSAEAIVVAVGPSAKRLSTGSGVIHRFEAAGSGAARDPLR